MKISAMVVAVLGVALTGVGNGVAGAEAGMSTIVAEDFPGSCLVVQNHVGHDVEIRLNYPTWGGYWTFVHDQVSVVADADNVVITSPSGAWNFTMNPPAEVVWVFDAGLNTELGCNGSWVASLT
ncbi:hypothetical protein [Nocardia sp. NPDC051833]|uniref:hypothetical protein n=1 Tax=Nocardia sp. NPDC051833 TaxID=3155674 RepID=UPI00343CCD48